MPHELLKLRVQEISAVDQPATRRRFLIVKRDAEPARAETWGDLWRRIGKAVGWSEEQIQRAEHEAESFDDMMARRRIGNVVSALYDHYAALIETLTSIANSDEGGTPTLVRAAIDDYLGSLKGALNKVIADAFKKGNPQDGAAPLTKFETARKALERLCGVEEMMSKPTEQKTQTFDLSQVPEAQRPVVKTEIERLTARIAELEKAKPTDPKPEDVLKNADPAVRQMIADLESRVEKAEGKASAAETTAATERAAREKAERVAKAQREFGGITADFGKVGEALHALDGKVDKAVVETIETTLKAASEQLRTQALFKELGHSAPPAPDSAVGKIAKRAEELMKADTTLTRAAAETKALEAHPELYDAYLAEMAAQ